VVTHWVAEAAVEFTVDPRAFTPPPRVTSAVTSLVPRPQPLAPACWAAMEALTAAAFGQRRKMLRGALRGLGGAALLAQAGIEAERRAETLTVAEFDRLAGLIGHRGD
jgi:16S rRNA (adenine1518-N6/adenine1519-N6)-dimethyltransferase